MHWYWIEPDRLAGGSCPGPDDWPGLQDQGFERIFSLLEDPRQAAYDPAEVKARFEWVCVPMTDHRPPDLAQLLEVHELLRAHPSRPALVHCYAGIGRTGLVALSHLMAKGLPEAEATRQVDAWTGDAFSWEIRFRREEVRLLIRDFLARWPSTPKA